MNNYRIAQALDAVSLSFEVQNLMDQGWIPLGGVAIDSIRCVYCQAMVRH
jgi:hypothetical protein